jgi:peptidoglycan hydrolase CwlO-like protein
VDPTVLVAIISAAAAIWCGFMVFKSSGQATNVNERAAELAWVKEIRQDAADARKDIDALQDQVRQLTRQLSVVTREAEHWIAEYQFLHRTIWREGISLIRLREIVGPVVIGEAAGPPTEGSRMHRPDDVT